MGFLIRSLAGVNTKASDLGMRVTSFEPEGVNVENTFAEVTGRPGNVDQGAASCPSTYRHRREVPSNVTRNVPAIPRPY